MNLMIAAKLMNQFVVNQSHGAGAHNGKEMEAEEGGYGTWAGRIRRVATATFGTSRRGGRCACTSPAPSGTRTPTRGTAALASGFAPPAAF